MTLTARQQEVLDFIKSFSTENGYPPSRNEIGDGIGITGNAVQGCLVILARKGVIELMPNIARGIRVK